MKWDGKIYHELRRVMLHLIGDTRKCPKCGHLFVPEDQTQREGLETVKQYFPKCEKVRIEKPSEKKPESAKEDIHLATVSCRQSDEDGRVTVVDLERFYSGMDIIKKYGKNVHFRYFWEDSRAPSMCFFVSKGVRAVQLFGSPSCTLLAVGESYDGADFSERIELMETCGKRLGAIVKEEKARDLLNKKVAPAMKLWKITI
jgi:hypothetical protein